MAIDFKNNSLHIDIDEYDASLSILQQYNDFKIAYAAKCIKHAGGSHLVMTGYNQDLYVHDFVMYRHPAAGKIMDRTLYVSVSLNLVIHSKLNPQPYVYVVQGLDECQYTKVTPLFYLWQYASIRECSLPLYIKK